MAGVELLRLSLCGFGPHRDPVEVRLSPGLNILAAPNEQGKSSLVAGLSAVIFGIPQTTDSASFGQGRFRNWHDPDRFEGEAEITVHDQTYRIRRNFDSNRVSLARLTDGRYEEIAGGEHNPGARKRNTHYDEQITALFGMTSRELFEATFCVVQPMPEASEIDGRVQSLLSGSGARFGQSLERLVNELKSLTRLTGNRGVTPGNMRDSRRLEKLDEEIAALQSAIGMERDKVDRFEGYRRAIDEAGQDRQKSLEDLRSREKILQAWSDWRRCAERYQAAITALRDLERARDQARQLMAETDQVQARIDREFADLGAAPAETPETLSLLAALSENASLLRRQQEETGRKILETATVRESVQREMNRLREKTASGTGLLSGIDWDHFSPSPAAVIREASHSARRLLASWQTLKSIRTELADIDRSLNGEYALFNGRTPEELNILRASAERGARLEGEWQHTRSLSENIHQQRNSARAVRGIVTAVGGIIGLLFIREFFPGTLAMTAGLFVGAVVAFTVAGLLLRIGRKGSDALLPPAALEARSEEARRALEAFNIFVKPFRNVFGDIGQALSNWEVLRTRKDELSRQAEQTTEALYGAGVPDPATAPLQELTGSGWPGLLRFIDGIRLERVENTSGSILVWLGSLEDSWWEERLEDAEAYEALKTRRDQLQRVEEEQRRQNNQLEAELDMMAQKEMVLAREAAAALEKTGGNTQAAQARWNEYARLLESATRTRNALAAVLAGLGLNQPEELESRCASGQIAAMQALADWQKLVDSVPGLPAANDSVDPLTLGTRFDQLQREADWLRQRIEHNDQLIRETTVELSRLEGQEPMNIAGAELRLEELVAERERLRMAADAITLAYTELSGAVTDFQSSHRERLALVARDYFNRFSGIPGRTVEIDDAFHVALRFDGREADLAQLSQGARDQLYIALRMAIASLLARDIHLPFIFDDPFLNCDEERLERIRESLVRLAEERQIIVLTHRTDLASWGNSIGFTAREH